MGDLNVDICDQRKDNNSFLSDRCDTFSLQNIITGKTCHKSNLGTSIDIIRVPTAPRNSSNLLDFYFPPRISLNLFGKLANQWFPPRISSIFFSKCIIYFHDILFQVQLSSRLCLFMFIVCLIFLMILL